MKLPNFLDRFKKERIPGEPDPGGTATPVPEAAGTATAPGAAAAPEVTRVETIEDALEKLQAIREALGRGEEDVVHVPCRALLARLPESLRGPAWQASGFPDALLDMEKNAVLGQLRRGKVSCALGVFLPSLPPGWVQNKPETVVELDLAEVVAAVPTEWLAAASRPSKALIEVADMPDFFAPKAEALAEMAPVAPVEALAPAAAAIPDVEVKARPAVEPVVVEPVVVEPVVVEPVVVEPVVPAPVEAVMPPLVPAVVAPAAPVEVPVAAVTPAENAPMLPFATALIPAATVVAEAPAVPVVPTEVQAAATVEEPEEPVVVTQPQGWDGLEKTLDSAVLGVDVNKVKASELKTLPGVGPVRAQMIVADRAARGPFRNIYELLRVPGIGNSTFRQMTGLPATSGRDRREVLNGLLGLEPQARPSLTLVANAVAAAVGAVGCVLTNADGIPLAMTPNVADKADTYAALTVQLFRRSSTSLWEITGGKVDCIALPTAKPPRILCSVNDVFLIVVFDTQARSQKATRRLTKLAHELGWFLGRRAVVRAW